MVFRLRLFGTASAAHADGTAIPLNHRHRVALLALLAVAPTRTLTRDKLTALLWPEQSAQSARRLLNVAVHGVRRTLHDDVLQTVGDDLVLSENLLWVDTIAFEAAIQGRSFVEACALYNGSFLDGFFLKGAPEFEHWQETTRIHMAQQYRQALEASAAEASASGALGDAVKWLQLLVREDPYNTGHVIALMLAMERAGDAPNALLAAHAHAEVLRSELGIRANAEFNAFVTRLRQTSIPQPVRQAWRGATAAVGVADPVPAPVTEARYPTPARVGWRWLAVGLSLAIIVGAVRLTNRPLDANRVYVAPFHPADAALSAQALAATNAVTRVLSRVDGVEILPPDEDDAARARARRLRAGTRIEGIVSRSDGSVWLEARVVATARDRVLRSVRSRDEGTPSALDEFAGRVEGALAMVLDERLATSATAEHREPNAVALAAFRQGIDFFSRAEYAPAARAFQRARLDSGFTLAQIWLALTWYHGAQFDSAFGLARAMKSDTTLPAADRFAFEWLRARSRGDVPGAYRVAREAARLAPLSPWAFAQAEEALALRRPREVLRLLEPLDGEHSWIQGWSRYRNVLGQAHHLLGNFDAELRLVVSARRVGSNMWASMLDETRPLAAKGRWHDVERRLEETLALPEQPTLTPGSIMRRAADELRAHGYEREALLAYRRTQQFFAPIAVDSTKPLSVLSMLGRSLYAAGDYDSARVVFERAYRRLPSMYSLQANLGFVAAATGNRAAALHIDSMLGAPDTNWNAFDAALRVYHRAQIAALLGDRYRALNLLQQAVAMGVPVQLDSIHIAPEFWTLRGIPAYDDLTRIR